MLLTVQLPLADARSFTDLSATRLSLPAWPIPQPGRHFVRSFGVVERRRRGGLAGSPGEDTYCSGRHAVRFRSALPRVGTHSQRALRGAFRRLLCDGGTLVRYELGLSLRRQELLRWPLSGPELVSLVLSCAQTPVATPSALASPLLGSRDSLAEAYLRSTTSHAAKAGLDHVQNWVVSAGTPVVVVEVDARALVSVPRLARPVSEYADVSVRHFAIDVHGGLLGVWLLTHPPEANRDARRRLRLAILRTHADRECLRMVLGHFLAGRLSVPSFGRAQLELEAYLLEASRRLSAPRQYGVEIEDILVAAGRFSRIVDAGSEESVGLALERVRRVVRSNLEKALDRSTGETVYVLAGGSAQVQIGSINQGGVMMTHKSTTKIKLGDGATFHGDFVVAERIEGSFNRTKSVTDEALRLKLETLVTAVAKMAEALEASQARQVADDTDTLVKESMRTKPRQEIWEVTSKGLLEAAQAVGAIGLPVIKAVKEIGQLFGL